MQLAKQWESRLSIVHAVEGHQYASWREDSHWRWSPDPIEWATTTLEREYFGQRPDAVELEVKSGNPFDVVTATAIRKDTNLIIGGVAQDEPYGRDRIGRLISQLAKSAPAPVLVVKRRLFRRYRRVVLASDLSRVSQDALHLMLRWFSGEELTLYHAADGVVADPDDPEDALAECQRWVQETADERASGLRIATAKGDPRRMVKSYAEDNDIDLLVIGAHSRSKPMEFFLGSVASELLAQVKCDILVVRHRM